MQATLRSLVIALAASCLQSAWLAGAASAQSPTISVDDLDTNHVLFETPPILDFSRSQLESDPSSGIEYTMEIEQDAKGRIRGRGRDTDGTGFDVTHVVKGKCNTHDGLPQLRQKMTSAGSFGGGDEYKAVGVVRGLVQGWGAETRLVGTLRSHVCLAQPGLKGKLVRVCTKNTSPYELALPDLGTWQMDFAFDRSGARLLGSGSITSAVFVPGVSRTWIVTVSGRVTDGSHAVIDLEPLAEGLGSARLEATISNTDPPTLVSVQGVRGRILGQRFNEAF